MIDHLIDWLIVWQSIDQKTEAQKIFWCCTHQWLQSVNRLWIDDYYFFQLKLSHSSSEWTIFFVRANTIVKICGKIRFILNFVLQNCYCDSDKIIGKEQWTKVFIFSLTFFYCYKYFCSLLEYMCKLLRNWILRFDERVKVNI